MLTKETAKQKAIELWRLASRLALCDLWSNPIIQAAHAELDKAAMALAKAHGFEYDDVSNECD